MIRNILLIDDSKQIHSLVSALLAEEPVAIHSAFDGESGLTLAESLRPDAILLDVDMPGIDGYEVCRRMKSNSDLFNIPVIFLTSISDTEKKVRGLELGAVDYVTKPFSPSELLARVRSALRISAAIQTLEQKALVDFLTGLGNRAMFKNRLAAEVSLRVRTQSPLACIVADVDNFQAINDVHGHPFGDRVLQTIGEILKTVCRGEDVPCRLGGDAFVILTPNTDAESANLLAERIQASLTDVQLYCRGAYVTVKCSVAVEPSIGIYDRSMADRATLVIEQTRMMSKHQHLDLVA